MQNFYSPSPAIEKKYAESENRVFLHIKIKYLSWNRWIYEQVMKKHQKILLHNNARRKCLLAHMQHFFSPSPAIEKKYAESENRAFFHTKIKNLSWNRWIYEQMVKKHQKRLMDNNATLKCLQAHMQNFFSPSPATEKKFAESAFFHTKIKTCHETVEFTSKWGKNTKNYSLATMPLASAFRPTCNISPALAPLSRKNWLNQGIEHFFIQKSKTCHETVEFRSQWGQNTKKLLLGNNAHYKCLQAHMQHFFSPSPAIDKKIRWISIFSHKNQKLVMKPLNLRANGGKTQKTTPAKQCLSQVPSGPHATFLQP